MGKTKNRPIQKHCMTDNVEALLLFKSFTIAQFWAESATYSRVRLASENISCGDKFGTGFVNSGIQTRYINFTWKSRYKIIT